jgi:peptidoglycan-associated lipoprotein
MSIPRILGLALPLVGASLFLAIGGCAERPAPPVVEPPHFTSAVVAPTLMPVVAISPSINVSDEIAKACKLGFDVIESAPKFDFDQSALGAQDSNALAQIAQCLTAGPLAGRSIELVGRADQRGEIEYNMALGERRASSVGQYLSVRGVESARMIQSSRGKLDATGTDEAGWKRDRRVDVLLRQ